MAAKKNIINGMQVSPKVAAAIMAMVNEGAVLVIYSSAMGGSAYAMEVNGESQPMVKAVGYQMPMGWMVRVSEKPSKYAIRPAIVEAIKAEMAEQAQQGK